MAPSYFSTRTSRRDWRRALAHLRALRAGTYHLHRQDHVYHGSQNNTPGPPRNSMVHSLATIEASNVQVLPDEHYNNVFHSDFEEHNNEDVDDVAEPVSPCPSFHAESEHFHSHSSSDYVNDFSETSEHSEDHSDDEGLNEEGVRRQDMQTILNFIVAIKERFMTAKVKTFASEASSMAMWDVIRFVYQGKLPCYKTVLRNFVTDLPKPRLEFKIKNRVTNNVFVVRGDTFPRKKYGNTRKFTVLSRFTRVSVKDILMYSKKLHEKLLATQGDYKGGKPLPKDIYLDLSLDGVPLDHSSGKQMCVMCIRVNGCKVVYPIGTQIYTSGHKGTIDEFLLPFLQEVATLPQVYINNVLADAPQRAEIRCQKQHGAYYGCDLCICEGVWSTAGGCVVMGPNSLRCEKRTNLEWRQTVRARPPGRTVHGITGTSPLLTLDYFDIVRNVPPDPLHLFWLGVTKNVFKLCFKFSSMSNATIQLKDMFDEIDLQYLLTCLPKEIQRQTRSITHITRFKGSELKALIMIMFHVIAKILAKNNYVEEAQIWTLTSVLIRINFLPEDRYRKYRGSVDIVAMHKNLYIKYADKFGDKKCNYNWHLFSHMPQVRQWGKMSDFTTEPFENCYGYASCWN
jgi:hypothetical protein